MFASVKDAICPESFAAIRANAAWFHAPRKHIPKVPRALEMQSSNSSDGLLMSVFCHPRIASWKGVSDFLGFCLVAPEVWRTRRRRKERHGG